MFELALVGPGQSQDVVWERQALEQLDTPGSEGHHSVVGDDKRCKSIGSHEVRDRTVKVLFGNLTGSCARKSCV
jgi:hypothetical protein